MVNSIIDSMGLNLSKLWETVQDRKAWDATVCGRHDLVTEQQNAKEHLI